VIIYFIEPHLLVVGGIRRIIEVANRLQKYGHEVRIFTPKGTPCLWLQNKIPTHKISKLSSYPKADVVIFNLAEQYREVLAVQAKAKVFWVLAPEGLYKNPDIPLAALRQGFHLATNSTFTKEYILKYVKVKYDIPVFPGGIDPSLFKCDEKIPKAYHVLLYGSARPWKGTELILKAVHSLPNIKYLKMEGTNTTQEGLYTLYNHSSLYCCANQAEGFSLTQLEAMACGCPVVTADDGGSRDYVINGVNAFVVKRTVEGIKHGISTLLNNTALCKKLKAGGLKTAKEERFSWDVISKNFETYLKTLC